MIANEQSSPPPKAVNIIRPSSPLLHSFKRPSSPHHQRHTHLGFQDPSQSSSTASSSSPSTLSTLSSFSNNPRATVLGPANFLSLYAHQHKPNFALSFPQRLLQRARSNSNLSKLTVLSSSSDSEEDEDNDDDDDDDEDLDEDETDDEIDGVDDDDNQDSPHKTQGKEDIAINHDKDDENNEADDNSSDDDEVSPSKIVARIKNGTIMNGRGEFVSKGSNDDHAGWLDEARANRKIADLEIEKASLLVVNTTLEATLRRQSERISELEKRLESSDGPLTPLSDKHEALLEAGNSDALSDEEVENDQTFQRLRAMLQALIEQAEVAVVQKTKVSGRVLTDYQPSATTTTCIEDSDELLKDDSDEVTIRKLAIRRSMSPTPTHGNNIAIMNRQHQRPPRRGSDSRPRIHPPPPPPTNHIGHTKTSMARTLSRQSSPAVMVSSSPPMPRPSSPRPPTSPRRPPSRASSLRRGQEPPRWR
ncbi:hypothetical protein BCR43DRAFT_181948 [Syncephalastrum racemosum]|uniref:Uncharacterized protein n=1 Tax=Syncephalastrum racemosum TaxID=13706 RepID=A0A1X2HQA6_SYNRA|nr:hypothetical protein BCR43DRAFT_181948 [Syncephalastrum racemosum]